MQEIVKTGDIQMQIYSHSDQIIFRKTITVE